MAIREREKNAFKKGFVAAYTGVLGHILDTDWSDCPADLTIIEQVVLVRNPWSSTGGDLTSFRVSHDPRTLKKYPRPFFVNEHERRVLDARPETAASWLFMPSVEITREALFAAVEHVEKLADWIEGRMDNAADWRMGRR